MKEDDINDYLPSLLNPRRIKRDNGNFSFTQNSVTSRCSLSLGRGNRVSKWKPRVNNVLSTKTLSQNVQNFIPNTVEISMKNTTKSDSNNKNVQAEDIGSIGFSAIQDLSTVRLNSSSSGANLCGIKEWQQVPNIVTVNSNSTLRSVSSATELNDVLTDSKSGKTVLCETNKPFVSVSFGITGCKYVDVSTNSNIKRIFVSHEDNDTNIDCEIVENSELSIASDLKENMNESVLPSPPKKLAVAVSLDIKKKTSDVTENSKVLILNTNAIEKLSYVIVQPPNYKLVKRKHSGYNKINSISKRKSVFGSPFKNGKTVHGDNLKQRDIESYFFKSNVLDSIQVSEGRTVVETNGSVDSTNLDRNDAQDMSKNSGVADAVKCDRVTRSGRSYKRNESPRSVRVSTIRKETKQHDIKISNSHAPPASAPRSKNESVRSHSPRKQTDSIQFNLSSKTTTYKYNSVIPQHKIVAGTHFAVDAFSYGDIPNVKHYFLTHFHSDHYSGLKKSFNKLLFCSKITGDLCITRLGVSPKCMHILNYDETVRIEGVEVTALDANHCPGALMLVFTLPNGKTLLHCGDFRASPAMESYPIFWNKDIHTIYLDTTYCNPRYDFPTQDQSLEMALYLLRQKKVNVEKAGKKFSSVLIVCGTYTIGKEKFFLGMARRVGCSVWAFPEKDCVLQAVEGRSFGQTSPQTCQLHVLAMRDLTIEKLKSYLESLQGAFSEVVAFKPSGWENGKNSTIEKEMVTIHGIPYSEHSSFSEMIRFVKFLNPKQVVPTVDISGGIKAVQKYFPCPLVYKDMQSQSKVTDYFSIQKQNRPQAPAVT